MPHRFCDLASPRFSARRQRHIGSLLRSQSGPLTSGLIGCGSTTPTKPYAGLAPPHEAIYVISGGWHTEVGLPVEAVGDSLTALKQDFPSARYLVFGWGARDYYMAQDFGLGDFLRGAVPGPAVMLVIPLEIPPVAVFGASNVYALPAPPRATSLTVSPGLSGK